MHLIRFEELFFQRCYFRLSEISRSMAWKTTRKLASRTFIYDRHAFKAQAIRSFHKR